MSSATLRNELKALPSVCFPLNKAEDEVVCETEMEGFLWD